MQGGAKPVQQGVTTLAAISSSMPLAATSLSPVGGSQESGSSGIVSRVECPFL